jgi:hypothetical protein
MHTLLNVRAIEHQKSIRTRSGAEKLLQTLCNLAAIEMMEISRLDDYST